MPLSIERRFQTHPYNPIYGMFRYSLSFAYQYYNTFCLKCQSPTNAFPSFPHLPAGRHPLLRSSQPANAFSSTPSLLPLSGLHGEKLSTKFLVVCCAAFSCLLEDLSQLAEWCQLRQTQELRQDTWWGKTQGAHVIFGRNVNRTPWTVLLLLNSSWSCVFTEHSVLRGSAAPGIPCGPESLLLTHWDSTEA